MLKKSQIANLILCQDRGFRSQVTGYLNGSGIHTEKVSAGSLAEAKSLLEQRPLLRNMVIDGNAFADLFNGSGDELGKLLAFEHLFCAAFFTPEALQQLEGKHQHPNLLLFALPFKQPHFNQAFHIRGTSKQGPALAGLGALGISKPVHSTSPGSPTTAPVPGSGPRRSLTALEASAHVKRSLELLNGFELAEQQGQIFRKIGQIFNGFIGAFAYFESVATYRSLRELAITIDAASRHVGEHTHPVPEPWRQLVLDAARCSFRLLQDLREGSDSEPARLAEAQALVQRGRQLGLEPGDALDQAAIDQLLG